MNKTSTLPISFKWLLRIFVISSIILSILAGYYLEALKLEEKRYANLEDKYVRVRNMIGRNAMQDLIDRSYEE